MEGWEGGLGWVIIGRGLGLLLVFLIRSYSDSVVRLWNLFFGEYSRW